MRTLIVATSLLGLTAITAAMAQTPPAAPAAQPAAAQPAAAHYTTADTDIGTILDTPALRAIVDKHIPGFSTQDQIDMARSMTLKAIQQYGPDKYTDKVLAEIDTDFAAVPASK